MTPLLRNLLGKTPDMARWAPCTQRRFTRPQRAAHPRSPSKVSATTPTILSSSSSAEPSDSRSCLHIHIHMHMHMHGTKRFTLVSPRPLHGLPVYPAKLPVEVHRS